jgi:hypothetical protein
MWNFLAKNPEIIIFLLVGGASILGRLRKAVEAGQGPGGIRIPPPTEIHTKNPIPTRTAAGQPVAPARVQPVRRPGRPKPGRPGRVKPGRSQAIQRPPQAPKRPPHALHPSPPQPKTAAEGPKHAADQPIESHFEGSKPAVTPPGMATATGLQGLLASRDDLRRAILMTEMLGRPLALR